MSQVEEVKNATDILEIIASRLELKRAGSHWRGLCPFHSEKSPSFFVSESLQRFKCYGCGEGGDVFTFLEKYEGMTFVEALEYLAKEAGITLERGHFSPADQDRKQILEVLNLAKEYYHYLLLKHQVGQIGRDYLQDRQVTSESIKVFQLGYSLDSWDGLIKYLHVKKRYPLEILVKAGLVLRRGGRHYDRFRHRLMFPLLSHRGQVVGFSGRVLDKETKQAKYINSPETMVYHKSQMLYGLSELYQEIRKKKEVIVVEGELDVISSTQAHVNHVVAIKGSALTSEQVKLLSRVAERILLSLDTDGAGIEATKRAVKIAQDFPVELRVISLSGGKDPDELARQDPQAWRQTVKKSVSVFEFFLQTALQAHDQTQPEGKRKIINELASVFKSISHAVEKDYYLTRLAEKLGVSKKIVESDIDKFGRVAPVKVKTQPETNQVVDQKPVLSRRQELEKYLWFLVFHSPEDELGKNLEVLRDADFEIVGLNQIRDFIFGHQEFSFADLSLGLSDDLQQILFDILYDQDFLEFLPKIKIEMELLATAGDLKKIVVQAKIKKITDQLKQIEKKLAEMTVQDGDPENVADLERQQQELLAQIVALKRA